MSKATSAAFSLGELEQFLYAEARLLDEKRWREWLDLFTPDGDYWIPLVADQPDPFDHMSVTYEDRPAMELRVRRFDHPAAHSLAVPWRTSHSISNVALLDEGSGNQTGGDGPIRLRSNFVVLEARGQTQTLYGGYCEHSLVVRNGNLAIGRKKVVPVNAEAPLRSLQIYL